MALLFRPRPGSVVICDYRTGFAVPEMTKRRPVVVISLRFRRRPDLCTVVPLSTKAPSHVAPYHFRFAPGAIPHVQQGRDIWAKCDMLGTVALARLDRLKIGRRQYASPAISAADLREIRRCVLLALGMDSLTAYL